MVMSIIARNGRVDRITRFERSGRLKERVLKLLDSTYIDFDWSGISDLTYDRKASPVPLVQRGLPETPQAANTNTNTNTRDTTKWGKTNFLISVLITC